jgi:hypothetical protein
MSPPRRSRRWCGPRVGERPVGLVDVGLRVDAADGCCSRADDPRRAAQPGQLVDHRGGAGPDRDRVRRASGRNSVARLGSVPRDAIGQPVVGRLVDTYVTAAVVPCRRRARRGRRGARHAVAGAVGSGRGAGAARFRLPGRDASDPTSRRHHGPPVLRALRRRPRCRGGPAARRSPSHRRAGRPVRRAAAEARRRWRSRPRAGC